MKTSPLVDARNTEVSETDRFPARAYLVLKGTYIHLVVT